MTSVTKRFTGKMNLDDSDFRLNDFDYVNATNITYDSTGEGQDSVIAPIRGNRLVNYTLPIGVNKVIGHRNDLVRNRIYYFVWNSEGRHSILFYDNITGIVFHLLESKTDCFNDEDILLFNPSYKINHIDIIYREEGDLIYFTDGQDGNIFCIDIAFINSFISTSIKREYIQMAKQTSAIPPFCFFEDDSTVTVNNLRKNLFKIKVRYVYNDLTKSVTSSQGFLALPVNQNLKTDPPSRNAKISIAVLTGEKNVTKVEILAAYNIGNIFSDYFLIETVDKAVLGLADNDVYVYPFYNNQAYNFIDVAESVQGFDYVPQSAFTQANANGNTIEYANIVEGYDNTIIGDNGAGSDPSSFITNSSYITIQSSNEFGRIMCYQGGNSGYIDDINNGNITIVFLGTFISSYYFKITTSDGNVDATALTDLSASAFRALFQTSALAAGYTIVSSSGYNNQVLVIRKSISSIPVKLFNFIGLPSNDTLTAATYVGDTPAYNWWSRYQFGVVYFDQKDRTNGVVNPIASSIQTNGYGAVKEFVSNTYIETLPLVQGTIWNKPPSWAYYYQVVRTKNLAKGYFIQWISDITLKEIGASVVDNSYAYIGINPLNAFIAENPSSSFLGYSFVVRDRIRFIKDFQSVPILVNHGTIFGTNQILITMTLDEANGLHLTVGDTITISGTTSNNLTFTIDTLGYSGGFYVIRNATNIFTSETVSSFSFLDISGLKYANKDFEILDLMTNPTINGIDYVGQYVKIFLPDTSTGFNFGSPAFYSYFFEIYRPAVPTQGNLNLFYEFGERYMVANPTTTLSLHQGKQQSQTINGGGVVQTPALINMFDGDDYGRYRNINTQPKIKWVLPAPETYNFKFISFGDPDNVNNIIPTLNYTSSYLPVGYIPKNSVYQKNVTTFVATTNTIIDIIDTTISRIFTIYASGLITYNGNYSNGSFSINIFAVLPIPSNTSTGVNIFRRVFSTTPVYDNQKENFSISVTLTVPIGYNRIIIQSGATIAYPDMPITLNTLALIITDNNTSLKQFCIDPNYSDYFQSAVNSNGRAWIHDINAKRQNFPTTIRFSEQYQQNTNINKTNRFYEPNLDDYDRSNGSIQKLFIEGRYLYVFHQFDIGLVPVLQQVVTDNASNPLQANSDKLLNKIQYPYKGKVGIGNVPESFAYHEFAKYGVDNNKGVVWRLSQNGVIEISSLYECDAFFTKTLDAYATTLNNGNGATGQPYLGNPTIYGGFDIFINKYIVALEEINRYDNTGALIFHQDPYTLHFAEVRDQKEGFECFTNYYPEGIENLGTLLVTFKNGQIWLHDSNTFCNFYGNQFKASITQVFKGSEIGKKQWVALSQVGSEVWSCPLIYTQTESYKGQRQESNLISQDFLSLEGSFEAAFLRDINSIGGILSGDVLKGIFIVVKFELQDSTSYQYINEATAKFIDSPLTTR